MIPSGIFNLSSQNLIQIVIHKTDVACIAPSETGRGCVIHLKNKVPYEVRESETEVRNKLSLSLR
jgi:hypothetical protein